jgi:hypothetical protein
MNAYLLITAAMIAVLALLAIVDYIVNLFDND